MSKARAAPVKQHSLPRLELMAAVTATRLCSYITTYLVPRSLSACGLTARLSFHRYTVRTSHRVDNNPATWRYCPSADNPTDLLTRGITYDTLHGPKWFSSPSEWPTWQQSDILHIQATDEELEVVQTTTILVTTPVDILNFINIWRFNTPSKLLSVTAYVL